MATIVDFESGSFIAKLKTVSNQMNNNNVMIPCELLYNKYQDELPLEWHMQFNS